METVLFKLGQICVAGNAFIKVKTILLHFCASLDVFVQQKCLYSRLNNFEKLGASLEGSLILEKPLLNIKNNFIQLCASLDTSETYISDSC